MRLLSYFWLNISLVYSMAVFLLRIALAELVERKLAVASTAAVLLLAAITVLQVVKAVEHTLTPPAPLSIALTTTPDSTTYRLTPEQINVQLIYFLEILKQQPTHYQALLNAGMLHEALGNTEKSAEYFARAAQNNQTSPRVIRSSLLSPQEHSL